MTEKEAQCATCSKRIKVQVYIAGFNDVIPFTCDRDSTVLTAPIYDRTLRSVLGGYPQSAWTEGQFKTVEAYLMACPCGDSFKHDALPKCPNCGAILHVERLGSSEFVVVGG